MVFLTYETEFVLFLCGAGKFCLAHHGLRQLTCDGKCDVKFLITEVTSLMRNQEKTPNGFRRRWLSDAKYQK